MDLLLTTLLSVQCRGYPTLQHFLFVFSACGGISTGSKVPVLTAYISVLAYGILFVEPPLEDCLTGLTGSSTRAETGCTDL